MNADGTASGTVAGNLTVRPSPWFRDRQNVHMQDTLYPGQKAHEAEVVATWHGGMMAWLTHHFPRAVIFTTWSESWCFG
jgi:hypothetical protein